jgi:hypothetical protein
MPATSSSRSCESSRRSQRPSSDRRWRTTGVSKVEWISSLNVECTSSQRIRMCMSTSTVVSSLHRCLSFVENACRGEYVWAQLPAEHMECVLVPNSSPICGVSVIRGRRVYHCVSGRLQAFISVLGGLSGIFRVGFLLFYSHDTHVQLEKFNLSGSLE